MHRFFATFPLTANLRLSQRDFYHQIAHVFRAKKGEKVVFFTSGGPDIVYEIIEIKKQEISLVKKDTIGLDSRPLAVHVFQAYPNKVSTMELIVQKLVEIGVTRLTFFPGEYSQLSAIGPQKQSRLTSIAREALEQCGGNEMIDIAYSEEKLDQLISVMPDMGHLVAHQKGEVSIDKKNTGDGMIGLWIGPEGGWSHSENRFLEEKNIPLWSFNQNILRLETAAIVGAGILAYNHHGE